MWFSSSASTLSEGGKENLPLALPRRLPVRRRLAEVVSAGVMLLLLLLLLLCWCCARGRLERMVLRLAPRMLASPDLCLVGTSTSGTRKSASDEERMCVFLLFRSLRDDDDDEDPRLSRPKLLERTSGCMVRWSGEECSRG